MSADIIIRPLLNVLIRVKCAYNVQMSPRIYNTLYIHGRQIGLLNLANKIFHNLVCFYTYSVLFDIGSSNIHVS